MNFKYFSDLLLALTAKEIKARYKHAILGFMWIFINPLIQMMAIGFVFSLIFRFGIENYYLFLFTGLLPWNFFSLSLNKATPRIVWDRNLIQKANFSREVIPLSIIFSHFFHFIASWLLLIVFLLITKQSSFFEPIVIVSQITAIVLLLVFASGISLITSALNVFYRDITFVTQAGITLWFYFTPIIYPLTIIPQKYWPVFYLNPLLTIFSLLQKPIAQISLPFKIIIIHILIIFLTLIIGLFLFRKKSKYFADWL